ncbi:metal ABC transporter permease [Bullifex porci]|uniref:Metal ABC transporter permease n=2 Tax=Bullifex porci TaxID=2606638 RepID=A0A7X2PCV8_9SPIO|nr:metal ABC transporter permease [Bullifex porci]MDD7255597.1 metal ABC transporter permease [Bullifex porci]MDY2740339.1 metal ABC transporter permease [Bullifex porci]MSU06123.1 metal ABC transporter permease [Bullifex porci]
MIEMFSYSFMQRAILVGLLVSLCSSLLGVSLVLRRFSMIGDGLSHVGFGALAIATVFSFSPLIFTIPVVVIAAILILRINEKSKIGSDSAIALISSSSLAIGVMMISYVKGTNTDINNFLFGSLLAVGKNDAYFSIALSLVVLFSYILLYPRLYAVTFDPVFARSASIKADRYTTLLAILSALTIVLGMRMLGSLLISALIIFPCLSAKRVSSTYKGVTILSAAISLAAFMVGITISYQLGTPVGASIVIIHLLVFIILSLFSFIKENIQKKLLLNEQ